jgi:hypothetical protein
VANQVPSLEQPIRVQERHMLRQAATTVDQIAREDVSNHRDMYQYDHRVVRV